MTAKPNPFTDENIAIFREMWIGGVSIIRISNRLRIHERTVHSWVKRLSLPVREQFESPWTEETTAKMLELRAQGVSATQIGKRLGLTKCQVIGRWHRLDVAARASKPEIEEKPMLSVEPLLPMPTVANPEEARAPSESANGPWPMRDNELLAHIADGKSWGEISAIMGISRNALVSRSVRIKPAATTISPGDVFGQRTVIEKAVTPPRSKPKWLVRCSCGKEDDVCAHSLRIGRANRCSDCSKEEARVRIVSIPRPGRTPSVSAEARRKQKAEWQAARRQEKAARDLEQAARRQEKKPKPSTNKVAQRIHPKPASGRMDGPITRIPEAPPPAFQERVRTIGTDGCRFPFGTPRTASFRFCGEKPVRGRPYCEACLSRAYVTLVREAA